MSLLKYVKPLVITALGFWLLVLGGQMADATMTEKSEVNTRGRNAAVGAGIGAAAGVGAFLVFGAIGVVTGGIGFGIGAVGLAALGAGAGGLAGAATGEATTITKTTALYSPWAWGSVGLGGAFLVYLGCSGMRRLVKAARDAPTQQ
jgi:hypothetical protein